MSGERPGEMRIGAALEQARVRAGLSFEELERQTKIRARYLRALELERWRELPSIAHGKAFLRTYAQTLGLDVEAVVDEYRRQVQGGDGESVARGRTAAGRPDGRGRRTSAMLVGVAAAIILGTALVVGLIVGSDGGSKSGGKQPAGSRPDAQPIRPHGTTVLTLAVHDPVEVCLVGGGGGALIDGQVLSGGDRERFERRRFELRFPAGVDPSALTLRIAGKKRRLPRADGPVAYEIVAPRHLEPAPAPPGERCP